MAATTGTRASLADGRGNARGRSLAASWLIAVLFGLLFAWDVWEALGNLVGLRTYAATLGTDFNGTGWTVLVAGLVLPVVCFVVALLLGRGRRLPARAGLLAVALCVSAALSLDVQLILGFESLVALD